MKRLRFFRSDEFSDWMFGLDPAFANNVAECIKRISRTGQFPNTCGPLQDADGIHEMRFDVGPGHRVYYCRYGSIIYLLLAGGSKKNQKSDIKKAKDIKRRYFGGSK